MASMQSRSGLGGRPQPKRRVLTRLGDQRLDQEPEVVVDAPLLGDGGPVHDRILNRSHSWAIRFSFF
jgi:hypothetical protein